MSQISLADTITGWMIYAFKTFAQLPFDLQVEPFVSGAEAQAERLIIKVEIGEQYLEADQGFNGNLTLTFKTTERDAAKANEKWTQAEAALLAGMQTEASNARAITLFSRLDFLTENATTSLDHSANFRHFVRTIPLHAKLL